LDDKTNVEKIGNGVGKGARSRGRYSASWEKIVNLDTILGELVAEQSVFLGEFSRLDDVQAGCLVVQVSLDDAQPDMDDAQPDLDDARVNMDDILFAKEDSQVGLDDKI